MTSSGWGTPPWRTAARRWAEDELHRLGRPPAGPMTDVSVQPWSAVWRIPTGSGDVLVKQPTRVRRWEGAAQRFCGELAPDHVDPPLAFDPATGRILLLDRGATMYQAAPDTRGIDREPVSTMVRDYARLQQSTIDPANGQESAQDRHLGLDSDRSAGLGWWFDRAAGGIGCWDPADAPAAAERQARLLHDLPDADPRHITSPQRDQVLGALDAIQVSATALTASPVPFSLEHGDLWPGNVLPPRPRPVPGALPRYRFIDFGDAAWSHPFLSLIMLVVECRHRWSVPDRPDRLNLDDPDVGHVLDAYLSCWTRYETPVELRRTLCHALRLASLRRSQAWVDNLAEADDADLRKHGQMPWVWLEDITRPVGP